MNALAGGGSFVTLPALIAAGVPSVQANASSTVALFPGGLASAWAWAGADRASIGSVASVSLRAMLVTTLSGGLFGAALLLVTSPRTFSFALPWLLLLASVTLTFGRRAADALRTHRHPSRTTILLIQFGLGIYGGYFGGAVGIMMLAVWAVFDGRDLKALNGSRIVLVSAANLGAVVIFIVAHAVYWPETLSMMAAATVGGYSGARLGRRAPPQAIRAGTLTLTFMVTFAFFVKTYGPMLRR